MALNNTPTLSHGLVVGRFITASADSLDDIDRDLDYHVTSGTVTLKPVTEIHIYTGDGDQVVPTTIVRKPITATINAEGQLIDATGSRGVWLAVGRYTVIYQLVDASVPSITIDVKPEHTEETPLDLTLHSPIPVPPGAVTVTTEDTAIRAERAALAAEEAQAQLEARLPAYVGPTNPQMTDPGLWLQTGLGNGSDFTLWIEDGQ